MVGGSCPGATQLLPEEFATLLILDVGLMDHDFQDHAHRVDEDMPLAPLDFLAAVIAASPPFWLVFAD